MVRLVLALAALVLCAGCLEETPAQPTVGPGVADPADETQPEETGRMSRQGADEPGGSYELVAEGALRTANVRELHWAFRESAPAMTFDLDIDFGSGNQCEILSASSGYIDEAGPTRLTLYETAYGMGWGMSSAGSGIVSAHAGDIDTRDVLAPSGQTGGASLSGGTFDGPIRVTSLLRGPQPWAENPYLPADVSYAISITCDEPFSVSAARLGRSALLADAYNLDGGAGAEVLVAGSANVQDQASLEFAEPIVRAVSDGFGYHGGQVVLDHPAGQATWTYTPAVGLVQQPVVESGPGAYTFTVDQAGAYFEVIWVAAWGFDGPLDLVPGLSAASVIDSPFG